MTAPIQFPTVTPGGLIQDPGLGGTLASSLAGVLAAMQERERLEMEKKDFESKQAYYKTLKEGNELENEQRRMGMKKEQRVLEAKSAGLDAYTQWVGSGAQQNTLGPILAKIKDPDTAQDFVDRVTKHRQQENEAALAATNQAQAQVATATVEPEIAGKKAQSQKAQSEATVQAATEKEQIAQPKAQLQYTKALAAEAIARAKGGTEDPSSRINAAINQWKTGAMTLGQAFKGAGLPLPEGVDANAKFDPSGQSRGMSVWKAQQKQSATQALAANSQIDELLRQGVKITRWTPLKEGVPFGLGRSAIPEREQALLAAGGQLASRYLQSVSGLAATDKEREATMRQIVPFVGDKPQVIKQKQIMREAVVQTMFDATQGAEMPMSEIITNVINAARAKGADPMSLKFLNNARGKALRMEQQQSKRPDIPALVADDSVATPDSLTQLLNSYGP